MKWTIGRKLFLGFASITILSIIVAGTAFINFDKINEASRTVKQATAITEHILEIRIEEKNYLLRHEQYYVDTLKELMAHLDEYIAEGKKEIRSKAIITELDRISASLETYEDLFNKLIKTHELVEELMNKMRVAGRDVQAAAQGRENSDELIISVLEILKEEKDYQIYRHKVLRAGEKTYQDKFQDAVKQLIDAAGGDPEINELADQYALDFNDLAAAYKYLDELIDRMREEGGTVQDISREIKDMAWARIAAAQTAAGTIMLIFLIIAVIVSVVLGVVISRMITIPLRQLVSVSQAIAKGDLTRNVTVKTKDETGRLAAAFQQMVEILRDLLDQAQNTAEKVSTRV